VFVISLKHSAANLKIVFVTEKFKKVLFCSNSYSFIINLLKQRKLINVLQKKQRKIGKKQRKIPKKQRKI
jgi:hypothetical protein